MTIGLVRLAQTPRLLGHLRKGHLPRAFAALYRAHGPVVQIKRPFARSPVTVLMGEKANLWAHEEAGPFLRPVLPSNLLTEHAALTKTLASAYTCARFDERWVDLLRASAELMADWLVGDVVAGTRTCEAWMHHQFSRLDFGLDCLKVERDFIALERLELLTRGLGILPDRVLQTSGVRRRRIRIDRGLRNRLLQSKNDAASVVRGLLSVQAEHPESLPLIELHRHLLPLLLESKRLGSLLASTLCTLASHPELLELVKAEADGIFSRAGPSLHELQSERIDTARRVYLETLRMFPPVPFVVREIMNPVSVEGYKLPLGGRVLIALATPHHLEEVFTDPANFDIDRFLPLRSEHQKPGAFTPFGIGHRMCPSQDWAELHVLLNLLTIVHYFEFRVTPDCYRLGMRMLPTSAPDRHLKIHVTRKRNALPG